MGGDALRKCRDCGKEARTEEGLELFDKCSSSLHGRASRCKECRAKQAHIWRAANKYHCTPQEYEERMESSSCCECCGKESDLVYDHCHDTMKFRGVLCSGCNRSIGQLGDTLESVERALNYLRKHYEHQI